MEKDKGILVEEIIKLEYEMFSKVNGIDGRAFCQDDYKTFYVMRYSQHNVFSYETLQSYINDLLEAKSQNRNLVSEKYGYMMEITDNDYYKKNLENKLPICSKEKKIIIDYIMELLEIENKKFSKKYPFISKKMRPENNEKIATSNVYMIGELKTYSKKTLEYCISDIISLIIKGENIIEKIQRKTISFYGFKSLEEMENKNV